MELKNKTRCNIAVSWCFMVSDYSNDRRMPKWKKSPDFSSCHAAIIKEIGSVFLSHLLPFTWSDSDILYLVVPCFSKFWDVHPFNWEDVCWSILYSDLIGSTGILKRCKEPQKTWRRRKGSSSIHQCLSCVDYNSLLAPTCIQICFSMFECIYMNDSVPTPLFSNDNRGLQRGLGTYVRTLNCTDILHTDAWDMLF